MEQLPSPQHTEPLPPTQTRTIKMHSLILGGIIAFVSVVAVLSYLAIRIQKTTPGNNPASQSPQTQHTELNNIIYFAKSSTSTSTLVDLTSGQSKAFVPQGYEIVDQYRYDQFPQYIILQKGGNLFSYDPVDNITNGIFAVFNDTKIKTTEVPTIYPSRTERDKFFIIINEFGPDAEGLEATPVRTRSYTFDASINKLMQVANPEFEGCAEYDSLNQRFFSWPCGEGIGHSIPLSITNMTGKKQKEVIGLEEFGLTKDQVGIASVHYRDGLFFAQSKGSVAKIVVLDPRMPDPLKETYLTNTDVLSQIKESYPYSTTISKETNTIVIGSDDFILLLRFDANHRIIQASYIPDKNIYANIIVSYNRRLYYQAIDNIRVINLDTWRIEKSIPSSPEESEVTLFSLPR